MQLVGRASQLRFGALVAGGGARLESLQYAAPLEPSHFYSSRPGPSPARETALIGTLVPVDSRKNQTSSLPWIPFRLLASERPPTLTEKTSTSASSSASGSPTTSKPQHPRSLDQTKLDKELTSEISLTHFRNGQNIIDADQNFADALRHFIAALRVTPDMTEALFGAGVCCQNLGRIDDALAYFRETTRQIARKSQGKRHHTTAECAIAECLALLGQVEDAIKQYSRVLKLDETYVPAYGGRADCWLVWGQESPARRKAAAEQAEKDYRRVLEIEPDNLDAHQGLANMFVSLEMLDRAVAAYEDLLKADPNHINAMSGLALLKQEKGELDASLSMVNQAVDNHLKHFGQVAKSSADAMHRSSLHCQRASCLVAQKRWEDALKDANASLELVDQHFALAQILRGQSARQLRQFDVAVEAFNAVIDELPNNSGASSFDGSIPLAPAQISEVLLMRAQATFGITFPEYVDKANQNDDDEAEKEETIEPNNDDKDLAVEEGEDPLVPADFEKIVRDNYNLLRSYVRKTKQPESTAAKHIDYIIQDCSRALQMHDSESMLEEVYDLLLSLQEALEDEIGKLD